MLHMSIKELEQIHKAFANRRRLSVVHYVRDKKDANLANIAGHLKLSYKATAKHVGQLTLAGILDKETRSGVVFFSISKEMPALARHTLSLL